MIDTKKMREAVAHGAEPIGWQQMSVAVMLLCDEVDTLRAQLAEVRAIKVINLGEADRILAEAKEEPKPDMAFNRAVTVAVLAVKDLRALSAALAEKKETP